MLICSCDQCSCVAVTNCSCGCALFSCVAVPCAHAWLVLMCGCALFSCVAVPCAHVWLQPMLNQVMRSYTFYLLGCTISLVVFLFRVLLQDIFPYGQWEPWATMGTMGKGAVTGDPHPLMSKSCGNYVGNIFYFCSNLFTTPVSKVGNHRDHHHRTFPPHQQKGLVK